MRALHGMPRSARVAGAWARLWCSCHRADCSLCLSTERHDRDLIDAAAARAGWLRRLDRSVLVVTDDGIYDQNHACGRRTWAGSRAQHAVGLQRSPLGAATVASGRPCTNRIGWLCGRGLRGGTAAARVCFRGLVDDLDAMWAV